MIAANRKIKTIFFVIMIILTLDSNSFLNFCFASDIKDENLKLIITGNSEFAFELYAKLKELPESKQLDGNLFFSPYSLSSAIAMAYMGAHGNTAKEIAEVMRLPSIELEQIATAFSDLQNQLQTNPQASGYQLNIANALWLHKEYAFLPGFLELNMKYFGSGLSELDFTKSEVARKTINTWVEEQTKNKIKDLIPAGAINESDRLILTNTIYFKGNWVLPFKEDDTKPVEFNVTHEKQVEVQMMYQKQRYRYAQIDDVQLLQIPYGLDELSLLITKIMPGSHPEAGKLTEKQLQELPTLSMLILLPKNIGDLDSVESRLNQETLQAYIQQMQEKEVKVYLPKFKMTYGTIELKNVLTEMGMKDGFIPVVSDFSGIDGKKDLFISSVLHKTFVEVNEKGTEAGAASSLRTSLDLSPPPPPVFRADKPFLFIIMDNDTQNILFMGRVVNPALHDK